ncbi:MAG: GYD domain-containing protein [Chloroflexi bacterium]|nr:GYD domain-containing protein [Chloroflexota bacterium]
MAHYLFRAHYSQAGIQGVLKDGAASRLKAVAELAASVGGRVETAYWSFGDDDFILIAELPGNAAAAAVATRVSASGAAGITTTVLLTAAEVDEARGMGVTYRPPGA